MTDLSVEQAEKLEHYLRLLKKWQKAINLVSKNTIETAWQRHFIDSTQLSPYIPEGSNVTDLGSGAGFPGLVLAVMRPDLSVTLIESDTRKCAFLSNVSRETSTNINIISERIEEVSERPATDIITARALDTIKNLLDYSWPFIEQNKDLKLLLLKGQKTDQELDESRVAYKYKYQKHQSSSDSEGVIVELSDVSCET